MDSSMQPLMLLVIIMGVILVLAWILLPFAMFGIKPLLRELIGEVRQLRYSLSERNARGPG